MRSINIKLLKDGRVCIHYFALDPQGPIETQGDVRPTEVGPIKLGGVRGKIVCHPEQNSVYPYFDGRETKICAHSDDPRAVTCPACQESAEFKAAMAIIEAAKAKAG
jgi:hypothetical protein